MLTGPFQSLAILAIIAGFYLLDFTLIKRFDPDRSSSGSGRSWDFTLLVFLASALLVIQPVLLPGLGWPIAGWPGLLVQVGGVLVAVAALALHAWARIHLRHYYAERVEVQPGHVVIDTGPYRLVRHPVITSFLGLATGILLINPAVTTLAMLVYTWWDFSRAARQEELLLTESLPGYDAYARTTPAFFPRLRSK